MTAALLPWLVAQLAAIGIAALRVPLAAAYPQPAEFQSIRVLLAVQIVGSAALLPILCQSWQTALAAATSGWVMLVLATALAAGPLSHILPPGAYLTLWLAALLAWSLTVRFPTGQLTLSAIATCLSLGGVLLWYFRLDFAGTDASSPVAFGPLTAAMLGGGWYFLLATLVSGVAALVLVRRFSIFPE